MALLLVAASGCGASGSALTGPREEAREEAPRFLAPDPVACLAARVTPTHDAWILMGCPPQPEVPSRVTGIARHALAQVGFQRDDRGLFGGFDLHFRGETRTISFEYDRASMLRLITHTDGSETVVRWAPGDIATYETYETDSVTQRFELERDSTGRERLRSCTSRRADGTEGTAELVWERERSWVRFHDPALSQARAETTYDASGHIQRFELDLSGDGALELFVDYRWTDVELHRGETEPRITSMRDQDGVWTVGGYDVIWPD